MTGANDMVNGTPDTLIAAAIGRIEATIQSLHDGQKELRDDQKAMTADVAAIGTRMALVEQSIDKCTHCPTVPETPKPGNGSTTGIFKALASSRSPTAPIVAVAYAVARNPSVQTILMIVGALALAQLFGFINIDIRNVPALGPPTPAGP